MFKQKAVFIDRDGTVIEAIHRPDFVKKITAPFYEDELRFFPDIYQALEELKNMGFLRIMVTNQPDVANGYMEEEVWQKIQTRVVEAFPFDGIKMCRHTPNSGCPNRKPLPGMLLSASDDFGIDLSRSYMIGDTDADTKAGEGAGCGTILIDRFYNQDVKSDSRVKDLLSAVKTIKFTEKLVQDLKALKH